MQKKKENEREINASLGQSVLSHQRMVNKEWTREMYKEGKWVDQEEDSTKRDPNISSKAKEKQKLPMFTPPSWKPWFSASSSQTPRHIH